MTSLDQQIRGRLETCNWYALRSVILIALDELPSHPGPPVNRMVCADTVRLAISEALGITQETTPKEKR